MKIKFYNEWRLTQSDFIQFILFDVVYINQENKYLIITLLNFSLEIVFKSKVWKCINAETCNLGYDCDACSHNYDKRIEK